MSKGDIIGYSIGGIVLLVAVAASPFFGQIAANMPSVLSFCSVAIN